VEKDWRDEVRMEVMLSGREVRGEVEEVELASNGAA
jgi:hypothetical protein